MQVKQVFINKIRLKLYHASSLEEPARLYHQLHICTYFALFLRDCGESLCRIEITAAQINIHALFNADIICSVTVSIAIYVAFSIERLTTGKNNANAGVYGKLLIDVCFGGGVIEPNKFDESL